MRKSQMFNEKTNADLGTTVPSPYVILHPYFIPFGQLNKGTITVHSTLGYQCTIDNYKSTILPTPSLPTHL
jgi:hypothetical protein